jgi:hypothetical protein
MVKTQGKATLVIGTTSGIVTVGVSGGAWNVGTHPDTKDLINTLAVDPTATSTVWAAGSSDVYRSTDGGASWKVIPLPPSSDTTFASLGDSVPSHALYGYTALAINSRGTMIVGDDRGAIFRSTDHGKTWLQIDELGGCGDNGCPGISAMIFDPSNPNKALAFGTRGNGLNSFDEGATWIDEIDNGNGGFYSCLAATPRIPVPSDPVAAPTALPQGSRYIAATHHLVGPPFLSFYNRNGGIKAFGLPLTEAYMEDGQRVQVFERARMAEVAGAVTVSTLGYWLTEGQAFPTAASSTAPGRYFAQTHQVLSGRFLTYWLIHHGDVLLGQPISPAVQQQNADGTGRTYLVQWFANGRLEYHPEMRGTPYEVSAGLVGREFLLQRGWL